MSRKFNSVHHVGRFIVQIMLTNFSGDIAVRIVPSVTIARSSRMSWVVGLDWIFGDVNFGWMSPAFAEQERNRLRRMKERADELGITMRQQRVRWSEY